MTQPSNLGHSKRCAADRFPRAALDAMVREAGAPRHDDGHTDCYYAGLLLAALPHLLTDDAVDRAANEIWPLDNLSSDDARDELRRDTRRALIAVLGQKNEPTDA